MSGQSGVSGILTLALKGNLWGFDRSMMNHHIFSLLLTKTHHDQHISFAKGKTRIPCILQATILATVSK